MGISVRVREIITKTISKERKKNNFSLKIKFKMSQKNIKKSKNYARLWNLILIYAVA